MNVRFKQAVITAVLVVYCPFLFAQYAHLVTGGTIEFERSVNKFAFIQSSFGAATTNAEREAFASYKATHPQFLLQKSTLAFSREASLFVPSGENDPVQNTFYGKPIAGQYNTVFTDFGAGRVVNQKKVFENTYLVKDSLRSITWKLTDETREIAGYTCRRANGLMLDSIYVVAFFTNRIPVPGGPESFSGLPGMILGVVLPHEHVSWVATKVEEKPLSASSLEVPVKGKPVNFREFIVSVKDVIGGLNSGTGLLNRLLWIF